MKLLAISDVYIPEASMRRGLESLEQFGVEVDTRPWEHASLEGLQEANLEIERGGAEAVALPADLLRNIADYQIAIVQFAPLGRAFIEQASSLKLIGVLRGGTENIAVQYATDRGICVMNTPGRNARAVAECTVGLILTELRNLARAHAQPASRPLDTRLSQQRRHSGARRQDDRAGRIRGCGPAGGPVSRCFRQSHHRLRPLFQGRSRADGTG